MSCHSLPDPPAFIEVRGARTHNLQSLDVSIPRDRLVVITGVSGSGKSSLAFDTIHAEGRRRFVETLGASARRVVERLPEPAVDAIDGLPPTVAVDQTRGSAHAGARSTVGTLTDLWDHLRVLYARLGTPHCPRCGREVRATTPERIVRAVLGQGEGRKVIVLAPLRPDPSGSWTSALETIRRAGLPRLRLNGELRETSDFDDGGWPGDPPPQRLEAVVDRLVIREGILARVAEGVDLALKLTGGVVALLTQNDEGEWVESIYPTRPRCPACDLDLGAIDPRTFSFNHPQGACPACQGLGHYPLPLANAVPLGETGRGRPAQTTSGKSDLPGDADDPDLVHAPPCPDCHGARLQPVARAVRFQDWTLPELARLTIDQAAEVVAGWRFAETEAEGRAARRLAQAVAARLAYLQRVGLGYLSIDRPITTLSGGELQRVRLASVAASGFVGVCCVLDEPTSGLHPADASRLLEVVRDLRDQGNTVLVVEHDPIFLRGADWIIDLGPGAGPEGGRLVAQGPPRGLTPVGPHLLESATMSLLRDASKTTMRPASTRLKRSPRAITVRHARARNLKGVEAQFPLGCLTAVTGVSGSGKSTLVFEVLARAAKRHLQTVSGSRPHLVQDNAEPPIEAEVSGLGALSALKVVDQRPLGRNARSTPATHLGIFDALREVFAETKTAKLRGFKPNRFSFNHPSGRCPECRGLGGRKVATAWLPEFEEVCPACRGTRFNPATLEVRFKGMTIADVLALRVVEARECFAEFPSITPGLDALIALGLGYLTLGQPAPTLSGGEARRIRLAAELAGPRPGSSEPLASSAIGESSGNRRLYLLDEPTSGLHAADVDRLARALEQLADQGHAVVVIEHRPELIARADWIIDLGPGGGPQGGRVVVAGPPGLVRSHQESQTGRYLNILIPEDET